MSDVVLYYPEISYLKGGPHSLHRMPYALLHLASPLKAAGFSVTSVDGRVDPPQMLFDAITPETKFVGISSLTGIQLIDGAEISKQIKAKYPNLPVIWGGWHASLLPDETLKESFVDAVCVGQGEEVVVELAKGIPVDTIPGMRTRTNTLVRRPIMKHPQKLDWSLINLNKYGPFIGYLTSFGCPWRCAFCAIGQVYPRKWWFREMDDVIYDMKYLVDNYTNSPVYQIDIDDDNFFINKDRVVEFCTKWNSYKNIPLATLAHVRLVLKYPDEMWKLLRKGGIRTILIGAESAHQTILDRLHKEQTPEQMEEFVKKCTQFGIIPELSFLTGFPDSDELDDFRVTIEFLAKMGRINPYIAYKLFWIRPYPGTELFEEFKKDWPMPKTMKQWSEYTLRNWPIWVSRELAEMVNYFVFAFQPAVQWNYTWESFRKAFIAARSDNALPPQRGI